MEIDIRKARTTDAGIIAALVKELDVYSNLVAETEASLEKRIRGYIDENESKDCRTVFIALNSAGDCVGYANVHWLPYFILKAPEGFVSELFVREDARNQGIGTELLAAINAEAESRGCLRLNLLNIRTKESYKRGFYKSRGWTEREELANFIYTFKR